VNTLPCQTAAFIKSGSITNVIWLSCHLSYTTC